MFDNIVCTVSDQDKNKNKKYLLSFLLFFYYQIQHVIIFNSKHEKKYSRHQQIETVSNAFTVSVLPSSKYVNIFNCKHQKKNNKPPENQNSKIYIIHIQSDKMMHTWINYFSQKYGSSGIRANSPLQSTCVKSRLFVLYSNSKF